MKFLCIPAVAAMLLSGTAAPVLIAAVAPEPVVAADGAVVIEEIVVTAEFRQVTVDNLAGSASVIDVQNSGTVVNHLAEVLSQAPNVNLASGASRGRYMQIRGIGERGQFEEPLNASVGLILDGVDLSGIGAAATLFDVQQVEVLRGPQGTLYGANALAGLINVVTPAPSEAHSMRLRLDAGDYGAFGAGAVVSGPLGDQAGYRISAQRYRDDGFIDNDFLRRENTDNQDERTLRGKFVWGGGATNWKLSLGYIDVDNGYDAFSLDNGRTTLSDQPGFDIQETRYAALSMNWDVSDALLFEGTVTSAASDIDYGYDEDWTFTGFDPYGYTSVDRYLRERYTTTVEARLLSKPGRGLFAGQWDWVAGVYALDQAVDLERQYTFDDLLTSDYDIKRRAVYAEISRALGERWRLTVGGRWERHTGDYTDSTGLDLDPDNDLYGGRLLLELDLLDNSLVYAGVTRGYNAGGFNVSGSVPTDLIEYDAETLLNFELGYKSHWLQERLGMRLALFYMQRDDIQIATSITRPSTADPNGPVEFIQYRGNATEGFNGGMELETSYQASDRLRLFANLGVLDTEYDAFVNGDGLLQSAREQAQAPTYQFFAGADYALTERLLLRLEVEGKNEYFFSDSHDLQADAYELLNASVTYAAERWQLRLWARNLTDEDYFVRGFLFGNDPRDGYTSRGFTQLGEPTRIGLSFQANL